MDFDRAHELVESLNEDDALTLYALFSQKFGWAGTFYNRQDASWQVEGPDWDTGEERGPLTDEEWEKVRYSKAWTDGLPNIMVEYAGEMLNEVVSEALSDNA